ncbi:hypothetical protein ZOSMA_4G00350 [Zostera marina]|uniref:Uncharacterized protein n=1 Tax=Zostera marina TaxID=29655 RepID=A0A0K9P0L8_ZOSMR|nr:hypothetical protein ZOSMA_4G00350 [Zostera marina]
MAYWSGDGDEEEVEDVFEDYDVEPYGGGFDLYEIYGEALPADSEDICYPITSIDDEDFCFDYDCSYYGSDENPTAYVYGEEDTVDMELEMEEEE